jgi:solute:Na+ symporter, SSS family
VAPSWSSHGAEQLIVQRVLACKNVRDGRRALMLSAALIFPLFLIFLLVGVMLWVYYQHFQLAIPLPEARPGIKANDFIYPIFMVSAVPHIFKGFLIVAILSAAMSSVSSAMTALASVSTMDIMKNLLKGHRDDEFFLRFSKMSTVFWAAALIMVAFWSRKNDSVLNAAFALRGLTSGALLGSLLLTLFWRRGVSTPVVIGMVLSLLVMTVIFMAGLPTIAERYPAWAKLAVYWPWYALIGTVITIGAAFIARSLLPKHIDAKI